MKPREWLERGLIRNDDPIDLLTDSWRGFNGLFYPSEGRTEWDKIKSYLSENISEEKAENLVQTYLKEINYLILYPVVDMRGNGKDTRPSIDEFKRAESNLERILAIFKVIYQVRCNLEHGQKSPSRKRDIDLCSSSWALVAEVVDINT